MTKTAAHHFPGYSAMECLECNGRGSHGFEGHRECPNCEGHGYLCCCECDDGTAADVLLADGQGAYCMACLPISPIYDQLKTHPQWIERATDIGRAA